MFKILILQRFYGLGDKQIEYQILYRTSFKIFLGFETANKIPDEKMVWAFRENRTRSGLIEDFFCPFNRFLESKDLIFNQGKMIDASFTLAPRQRHICPFNQFLESKDLIFNQGKMIDASFTLAPRQRHTREEKEKIKNGEGDDLWNDKPHKKSHKDIDARWAKKTMRIFMGIKIT